MPSARNSVGLAANPITLEDMMNEMQMNGCGLMCAAMWIASAVVVATIIVFIVWIIKKMKK